MTLNQYHRRVHIYLAAKDALPSLTKGQLAYYTELDEEGAEIYEDFNLQQSLFCRYHKDTAMVLDFEKYPLCLECLNRTSEI